MLHRLNDTVKERLECLKLCSINFFVLFCVWSVFSLFVIIYEYFVDLKDRIISKSTFRQYVCYVLCIFSFLFWIICLLKSASVTVSSSDMHTFTHVIMVSCMKSKADMCSMIFFCELCFDKFRVLCDLFNGRMNQINTSVLFVDYFKTFILERYFAN